MTALGAVTPKPRATRRSRSSDPIPRWLWAVGVIVALYLVLPTLFVIPMSISEATTFIFPPRGFTFRLYENFFTKALGWLVGRFVELNGQRALVALSRSADGRWERF